MDYVYLAETCIIRIVKVSVHYYVGLVNKHSAHVQFKTYLLARTKANFAGCGRGGLLFLYKAYVFKLYVQLHNAGLYHDLAL